MEKFYILDTNVLLHDPMAIHAFAEHHVVIPMTVLEELDIIKDRKDKGYISNTTFIGINSASIKEHQTNNNIYKVNEVGSFLQANLILDEKLHLNGGFRYDRQMIGTNIGYEIIDNLISIRDIESACILKFYNDFICVEA